MCDACAPFGAESWYLTDNTLQKLETFQCTLGRRILRLSRFHSNKSVLIGLDWPSMRARLLIRKLNFLKRVLFADDEKLSSPSIQVLRRERCLQPDYRAVSIPRRGVWH